MKLKAILLFLFFFPLTLQGDPLKFMAAQKGGTYYKIGKSLEKILPKTIRVVPSPGSRENLITLGMNLADLAIVQWDVLLNLKKSKTYQSLQCNLLAVMALYREEVHILVRKDSWIQTLEDLIGKNVAVGPVGSGSYLSAIKILKAAKIAPSKIVLDTSALSVAMARLYKGKIDGLFYTVGQPLQLSKALWKRVTLLDLREPVVRKLARKIPDYSLGKIRKKNYPFLAKDIFTLSVPCVLVTTQNCSYKDIFSLCRRIFDGQKRLIALHPKWKEVSLEKTRQLIRQGVWPFHPGSRAYFFKSVLKDSLKLMSGPKGSTYQHLGNKLVTALAGGGIRLEHIPGRGSIYNLIGLSQNQTHLGLASVESLLFFQKSPYQRSMDQLRCLIPLSSQTIHLLVPRNSPIHKITDLKGKTISCGPTGSETYLTTTLLFSMLKMDLRYAVHRDLSPPPKALDKLIQGKIQGLFVLGKAPIKMLTGLSAEDGRKIRLLPLTKADFPVIKKFPFPYQSVIIPGGTYNFATKKTPGLASICLLIGNKKLSYRQGREIVEAIIHYFQNNPREKEMTVKQIQTLILRQKLPIEYHKAMGKIFSIRRKLK